MYYTRSIIHPIMINDSEAKLLSDWEDVFKQGLLSFWVMTALKDATLTVSEIGKEVARMTRGSYTPAEQTLYRVLRKYHDTDLVDYIESPSKGGPAKKMYNLTDLGERMLSEFAQRNIELFQIDKIKKIIDNK